MSLRAFIAESNAIEADTTDPAELEPFYKFFLGVKAVRLADLQTAAQVFQPGALLRNRVGMNVRVGNYLPPAGCGGVTSLLRELLKDVNGKDPPSPWHTHCRFEWIHPFTDGNGRTGRLLWLWQMHRLGWEPRGVLFLQTFYYQTLEHA